MSRVLVLCYHALSPTWPAQLSTTPERFAAQMHHLRRRGWRGVTFHQAVTESAPGRRVAVTFDDAFRSVATLAKPVLDELSWPATVYVPTSFPDAGSPLSWQGIDHWKGGSHEAELAVLDWAELRALADAGWEIGSHTRTHPRLTTLGDDALRTELAGSREDCEKRLDRRCHTLAYPYGDVDGRVASACAAAGYDAAAALPAGLRGEGGRHAWPRVGVYQKDSLVRFRLKVALARKRAVSAA